MSKVSNSVSLKSFHQHAVKILKKAFPLVLSEKVSVRFVIRENTTRCSIEFDDLYGMGGSPSEALSDLATEIVRKKTKEQTLTI